MYFERRTTFRYVVLVRAFMSALAGCRHAAVHVLVGSAAISSPAQHLVALLFQQQTGTEFAIVPYRGGAVQDLVAGQIDLSCITPDQLPLMRAGSIKAYAATSDESLSRAPDIPTFAGWDCRPIHAPLG